MPNPDGVLLPESEQNTPEDKKIGFKPWDSNRDRYWMGQQWSETYRERRLSNVNNSENNGHFGNKKVIEIEVDIDYHDTTDGDPDELFKKAKLAVIGSYNSTHEIPDQLETGQLYIVWFAKVLRNWKALVSTSRFGDKLYFEVTYNGDPGNEETYVDTYRKEDNQVFSHHDQ